MNIYSVESDYEALVIPMQLFFAIVTFLIFLFATRISQITGLKKTKYFGVAFFFFFLSYVCVFVTNSFLLVRDYLALDFNPSFLVALALYAYMLLSFAAVVMLDYVNTRERRARTFYLMLAALFAIFLVIPNVLLAFFIVISLFFARFSLTYLSNYLKHKNEKNFVIALAFFFLFIGQFVLITVHVNTLHYLFANLLGAIGYSLILLNYVMVHYEKKR